MHLPSIICSTKLPSEALPFFPFLVRKKLMSDFLQVMSLKWGAYVAPLQLTTRHIFGKKLPLNSNSLISLPTEHTRVKPLLVAKARNNARKESAKIRNRRMQKKFNGTPERPRLSVFCSAKQLYAVLADDKNKKCLFYGSTLQKSIRTDPACTTIEAAERVGEELIKACVNLNIDEISSYDSNGCPRGERIRAFEIAIYRHGFLPR